MARIGQDLAKIRKIQGKTLEDVHRSSRIPVSVLSSIEDGSLFGGLSTNKTMIRSNVRSFARVLKLDDDAVIAALDRLAKGDDTHFLEDESDAEAQEVDDSASEPTVAEKKEIKPHKKPAKQDPNETTEENYNTTTGSSTSKEGLTDKSTASKQEIKKVRPVVESPYIATEATNSVSNREISSVDWEKLNRKSKMMRPPASINWLSVFGAVVILILGSLYFVGYFDFLFNSAVPTEITTNESSATAANVNTITDSENWLEQENTDDASNEDVPTSAVEKNTTEAEVPKPAISIAVEESAVNATLEETSGDLAETTIENEANEPVDNTPRVDNYRFMNSDAISLPEELEILVYAASDNLAPVRLQWDGLSSLRPYWVEVGQAMRVGFKSELRIRTLNYSRMILVFNGHAVTNLKEQFYNEDAGLLVIPRSFFDADPASWIRLKSPTDDFDGISRPSKIIDRPTFN